VTRRRLHQARVEAWTTDQLSVHVAAVVYGLARRGGGDVSPLDVALELLGGELEAFVLFGRVGHLDPPRPDGKVPVAVLRCRSEDPEIDAAIRETALKWAADDGTKD
jgi:hypothetical protein